MLATGSIDCTARLWNPATGEHIRTLDGHTDVVTSVAFSSDGSMLATGSEDATVRIWD
jgi:WD40 repeat protein